MNTRSRRGQAWFADARRGLEALGVHIDSASAFQHVRELKDEVRAAIDREAPLIVVGGGDGTFSAVARYFVGRASVLGVLPLGTGNAFARDLGITADLPSACAAIANGTEEAVDLGIAGDDYFLNVATVGLTTSIALSLTVEAKRRWGRFVYAFALLRGLRKLRPFHVRIETENGDTELETLQVVLGNGRYHAGPFPLSPDASITDARLSLYALKQTKRSALLRMALNLPLGLHVSLPEVHAERPREGRIITTPVRAVTVDGEVCVRTPFTFSVAPRALRVMTPAPTTA